MLDKGLLGLDDHELAHELADRAAQRLLLLLEEGTANGDASWEIEAAGDTNSHLWLAGQLAAARPDDALLSEEGEDDLARLSADRVWIIDPLDGSSSFGVASPEWAVHVALVRDGNADVGAVASPGVGVVASTHRPPTPAPEHQRSKPILLTGRTRFHNDGRVVGAAIDAEVAACSSAGVKAALVATGQADAYVHNSPLFEWDVCAPAVVATAAGFDVSTPTGGELVFNKARPVVDGLVITRPDLTASVLESLRPL